MCESIHDEGNNEETWKWRGIEREMISSLLRKARRKLDLRLRRHRVGLGLGLSRTPFDRARKETSKRLRSRIEHLVRILPVPYFSTPYHT